MKSSRRTLIALLPVFLIVSACSNDDATPKAATDALPPAMATMSGELHALLPDDIREAGVIKTGGPVTEAPTLYLEKDAITRTGYMTDFAMLCVPHFSVLHPLGLRKCSNRSTDYNLRDGMVIKSRRYCIMWA